MKFHIVTPTVVPGDAVSQDALGMHDILQAAGFKSMVYAENIAPELHKAVFPISEYEHKGAKNAGDILIFHHSVHWEHGEELFSQTRNRKIIKYHNITPPHYFAPYSNFFTVLCHNGRQQTARLVTKGADLYLGDSLFNVQELIEAGADPDHCHALPPLHQIEELSDEKASIGDLEKYLDGQFNIVFVGRFAPNKGHLNLLRTFACFQATLAPRSRLILVGKIDPELSRYVEEIHSTIDTLGLSGSVVIISDAPLEQLRAVYLAAHIFLCLSEHEGFCVPLVEAMFHKIPIVALKRAAVPETLGSAALLADEVDEILLSEMIAYCLENKFVSHWLAETQYERYLQCFSTKSIVNPFLSLVRALVA